MTIARHGTTVALAALLVSAAAPVVIKAIWEVPGYSS